MDATMIEKTGFLRATNRIVVELSAAKDDILIIGSIKSLKATEAASKSCRPTRNV